jgi:hypothetical protein
MILKSPNVKVLILGVFFISQPVYSATVSVVDTGAVPGGPFPGGFLISQVQWLGGQFTVDQNLEINIAQGWVTQEGFLSGKLAVSLFSDSNDLPDSAIFTREFDVAQSGETISSWLGPTDLSWSVTPGEYWLVFLKISDPENIEIQLNMRGTDAEPPPNPLSNIAYYTEASGAWFAAGNLSPGIRVSGSPVPIPPAVWLFGSALGLLGWVKRRKAS